MNLKFGAKPREWRPTLHYAALRANKTLNPIPSSVDYTTGMPTNFGMMLNDTLGDCVCAAINHGRQVITFNGINDERTTPDADVLTTYEQACGYNPSDPSSDGGCDLGAVLSYWSKPGQSIPGGANKILGYVEVDVSNDEDLNSAIYECGGLLVATAIYSNVYVSPIPEVWNYDATASIIGYHGVWVPGYGTAGRPFITWGQKCTFSPEYWSKAVDQAYAVIDEGWLNASGRTVAGLNLSQLQEILTAIGA